MIVKPRQLCDGDVGRSSRVDAANDHRSFLCSTVDVSNMPGLHWSVCVSLIGRWVPVRLSSETLYLAASNLRSSSTARRSTETQAHRDAKYLTHGDNLVLGCKLL